MHQRRFLLFAGYDYYPCGGVDDMIGSFETEEGARVRAGKGCDPDSEYCISFDWYHILDTATGEVLRK